MTSGSNQRSPHVSLACEGFSDMPYDADAMENLLRAFCKDENDGIYTAAILKEVEGRSQFNKWEWTALEALASMLKDGELLADEVNPFITEFIWDLVRQDEILATLEERKVDWNALSCRIAVSLTTYPSNSR